MTQREIAESLGVSPAVVSQVLRDPDTKRASAATKARILQFVSQLPTSARPGDGRDTVVFVLDTTQRMFWYLREIVFGAQERAEEIGLRFELARPGPGLERVLATGRAKGVLLTQVSLPESVRNTPEAARAVHINMPHFTDCNGAMVVSDEMTAMDLAVQHLLDRGIAGPGYIGLEIPECGAQRSRARARERIESFQAACRRHSVPSESGGLFLLPSGTEPEELVPALKEWLQALKTTATESDPVGCVVYNDVLATQVYMAAKEVGVRIPEELSLIGIDNEPICNQLVPRLTSVSMGFAQMGAMAVDVVQGGLAERNGFKFMCEPELIVRDSVRSPCCTAKTAENA